MNIVKGALNFKACVEHTNFRFDSLPPVMPTGQMQKVVSTNLLQDTMESLTWLAHSHQAYRQS